MDWTEIALASAVPVLLVGGLAQRYKSGKGIGTQFIRFAALGIIVPVGGILAMRGHVSGDTIAAMLGAALGYVFGRMDR